MARLLVIECIAAGLFYLFEIFGYQWKYAALVRVNTIDRAAVLHDACAFVLNQEGALIEKFAACAAAGALTLPPGQQGVVLFGKQIRAKETANLTLRLFGTELESR